MRSTKNSDSDDSKQGFQGKHEPVRLAVAETPKPQGQGNQGNFRESGDRFSRCAA
jgi:hypothetical protein